MFKLNNQNQEGGIVLNIKKFFENFIKNNDYLIFKITSDNFYLLNYVYKKNEILIKTAKIIQVQNFFSLIDNQNFKESFTFLIQEFFKKNLIKLKASVGIIPEEKIFYKLIHLPKNVGSIEKVFSIYPEINIKTDLVCFEKIDSETNKTNHEDYSLWITNKNYVEKLDVFLNSINLKILGFEPENKLILKAIFEELKNENVYLIINISKKRTIFIIASQTKIYFSEFLNFGEEILNNLESKEKISRFLEEINNLIYFYNIKNLNKNSGLKINKILIIGNINLELISLISLNVKIKTEKLKVFENLKFKNEALKNLLLENQAEFISLVGGINKY